MGLSWKIGRVAGIDLFLHPTFLLLLLLGYSSGGAWGVAMMAAVFACVVLHELGHALTARLFGIGTRDITLYPIGGVARLERMPRAPGAELLITLAGPLVNVGIAAVLWASLLAGGAGPGWGDSAWMGYFLSDLMMINLFLAAFNMVPAFPMDGGRVLRSLLSVPIGRYRATEVAATVGRVLAVGFGVYSLLGGQFVQALLAAFVYFAAGAELAQARAEDDHRRGGGSGGMWTAPPGHRWVSRGNGVWQLAPIRVSSDSWERRRWR